MKNCINFLNNQLVYLLIIRIILLFVFYLKLEFFKINSFHECNNILYI